MTECPEHHVILPQIVQYPSSAPEDPRTAFRGRAGTPYPVTPTPKSPNPNILFPDIPNLDSLYPNTSHPDSPYLNTPYQGVFNPDSSHPGILNPDIPYPDTPYPDTPYPDTPYPDTPYPDTPYPDTPYPDTPYPDTPYPSILNPSSPHPGAGAGAGIENREREAFFGLAIHGQIKHELDLDAEARSICELAAESGSQEWLDDRITSKAANDSFFILGPNCNLARDTKYTQSSGSRSDAELRPDTPKSPPLYRFPYSIPIATLKTYDPAQNFTYPFSFPRMAYKRIFAYAKHVALEHYMENTLTYTYLDGSQYSLDNPEMEQLIVSKIKSAEERVRGQLRGAIRKEYYSGAVANIYQDARAQPRLCATARIEAIRAVDEAFKEIDRRVGILDLKESDGSLLITDGKHLSRLAFSFDYPSTRSTVAYSHSFPCLCKEGFAHEVCSEVLFIATKGLEHTNMESVDAERWEYLDRQFRHNLNTLVPEAMVKALREIWEPEDEDRCCGWKEKTHVKPWMRERVWDVATRAAEMIRQHQFCLTGEDIRL